MSSFSETLKKAPKGLLIMGGVTILVLLLFGFYKLAIEDIIKKKTVKEEVSQVIIEFPDADESSKDMSKVDEIRRLENSKKISPNDYWNSLGNDVEDGGLMSSETSGGGSSAKSGNNDYLDPNIYSDIERYYIQNGTWTKEQVDRQHEEKRLKEQEEARSASRVLTQEQRDSVYFARMDKAYQLAQKYTNQPDASTPQPVVTEEEPKEELKHIDIEKKSLPSTTLRQEDIISSLDSPDPLTSGGEIDPEHLIPAKATFLNSESLVSGQRVIMRLMQDLYLSDGTLIPANTHVKGICNIGDRLKISITTINYGGKIYYTNLDIYDNDGTEGIYCPVIVNSKKNKSGKKIGNTVLQGAATIASSLLSSNPYLGRVAGQGIREITQSIDMNGNISVSVTSGYEFFVFENTEKNEKATKNKRR